MGSSSEPSSSSSSSRSASPEPPKSHVLKRKRKELAAPEPVQDTASSDSSSDSDDSDSEHEDGSATLVADEPVLSHAERRRQKREARLAEKRNVEGGPAPKKRKVKDGKSAAVDGRNSSGDKPTRKNSVWVGNMSFKTQPENLRTFFQWVGGEITRINMPTKAPAKPGMKPENRGFAYVDFSTPEAKTAAIALSEQPLLGRKLLIKDGDSFEGRPAAIGENVITDSAVAHKTHSKTAQKILRNQKQPAAPTLFIGNLPFEATEESIKQLFEAHRDTKAKGKEKDPKPHDEEGKFEEKPKDGWMRKIRMGTFEDTGHCKGFAFVDFTSIDHATSALINPRNHRLNGRDLVVEYASPDAVRRGAPKGAKPADSAPHKKSRRVSASYDRTKPKVEVRSVPRHPADIAAKAEAEEAEEARKEKIDHRSVKINGSDGVSRKGPRSRPKPGAALALAKRESAAIVASQGQKITF